MHVNNSTPHIAIDIPEAPPAPPPSGPQSRSEKAAAWVGAAGQQAVVSGAAWGFANKLPVAIGTTVGAAVGGPAGAAVGAAVGNLVGGATLGITHYSAELACNNARVKMGHGFQYQPDPGAGATKFTYNSFIGTFSTIGGAKSLAKAGVEAAIGDGKDWAKAFAGVAVDTGSSMIGGAIAQTIINDRQHLVGEDGFNSEIKYKELKDKKFDWGEATTRMQGGVAAGASGGLLAASTELVQNSASSAAQLATGAMMGAAQTSIMLHTWFNARETFANPPKPAAPPPPPPTAPPPPQAASTATGASGHLGQLNRTPGLSESSRYFDTVAEQDDHELLGDIEMGHLHQQSEITEEHEHHTPHAEGRA
jgi:hypothetical protein